MDRKTAIQLLQLIRLEPNGAVCPSMGEWPLLIRAAQGADVAGLMASHALNRFEQIPAEIRQDLQSRIQAEARHRGYFFIEAERITETLSERSIRSVVLKGVGLARTIYHDPAQRSFRDLDILVDRADLDRAVECLESLGLRLLTSGALEPVYRREHFHLIFEGAAGIRIELHWGLTYPGEGCRLETESLLERARPPAGGGSFCVPAPVDQILHCALNLLRGGFTELKRLVDMDRLVRLEEIDWAKVRIRAERAGLAATLRLALELCGQLLGTPLGDVLSGLPQIPRARRKRLETLGIDRFPLRMPPATWPLAPRMVRAELGHRPLREMLGFIRRTPFERARLRALGISRGKQNLATIKRAALVALLLVRVISLRLSGHRFTPLI